MPNSAIPINTPTRVTTNLSISKSPVISNKGLNGTTVYIPTSVNESPFQARN